MIVSSLLVPVLSILWAQSEQVPEKFSAQNKLMLAHQLEISETSFETKKMVFVSSMSYAYEYCCVFIL